MGKFDYLLIKDSDSDSSEGLTQLPPIRMETSIRTAQDAAIPAVTPVVPVVAPTTGLSVNSSSIHVGPIFRHELVSMHEMKAHPDDVKASPLQNLNTPKATEFPSHGSRQSVSKTPLNQNDMPEAPPLLQVRNASLSNRKSFPRSGSVKGSAYFVGDENSIHQQLNRQVNGKRTLVNTFRAHNSLSSDSTSEHLRPASQRNTDTLELTMDSMPPGHEPNRWSSLKSSSEASVCKANLVSPVLDAAQAPPLANLPRSRRISSPKVHDRMLIPDHPGAEASSLIVPSGMNADPVPITAPANSDGDPHITFSSSGHLAYTPPPSVMGKESKIRSGCGIFSFCRKKVEHTTLEDKSRPPVSTVDDDVWVHAFDSHSVPPPSDEVAPAGALENALPHLSPTGMLAEQSIHTIYALEREPSQRRTSFQEEDVRVESLGQLPSAHLLVHNKLSPTNQPNRHISPTSLQLSTLSLFETDQQQQMLQNETVPAFEKCDQVATCAQVQDVYDNKEDSMHSESGAPVVNPEKSGTTQVNNTASGEDSLRFLLSSGGNDDRVSGNLDGSRGPAPQSADCPASHLEHVSGAAATPCNGDSSAAAVAPSAPPIPDNLTPSEAGGLPRMHSRPSSEVLFFRTDSLPSSKGSGEGPPVMCATKSLGTSTKPITDQMGVTTEAHYLISSGESTPFTNDEQCQIGVKEVEYGIPDDLAGLPLYQRRILLDLREAERREIEEVAKNWRHLTFHPRINKCPTQILECTQPFSERLSKPRQQKSSIPSPTPVRKASISNKVHGPHRQPAKRGLSSQQQVPTVFDRLIKRHSSTDTNTLRDQAHKEFTYTPEISDLAKRHVSSLDVVSRLYPQPPQKHNDTGVNASPQRVVPNVTTPECSRSAGRAITPDIHKKSVFERLYCLQKPPKILSQTSLQPIRRLYAFRESGSNEVTQYPYAYDENGNNSDGIARRLYLNIRNPQDRCHHTPFYSSDTSTT
ncbi:unnamed protein product [Phytomonas sp. EM1]|nr:unnamed protein product [Phytomonas sp. EM1]|eukprot:CCW59735.1 unnamed protein product [Phytomonas sp. isolate EM1]